MIVRDRKLLFAQALKETFKSISKWTPKSYWALTPYFDLVSVKCVKNCYVPNYYYWLSILNMPSRVCTLSHSLSFKWSIIELLEVNCLKEIVKYIKWSVEMIKYAMVAYVVGVNLLDL